LEKVSQARRILVVLAIGWDHHPLRKHLHQVIEIFESAKAVTRSRKEH